MREATGRAPSRRIAKGLTVLRAGVAPSSAAIEWASREVLLPALRELLRLRPSSYPVRYVDEAEYAKAVERLVRAQVELLQSSTPQSLRVLLLKTGFTQQELATLIESIDWRNLCREVRLRASPKGSLRLDTSVLMVKSAARVVAGANVFATDAPAPPTAALSALARLGRAPEKVPPSNTPALESSAYVVEMGPEITQALAVEALPEATWFDPDQYPEDVRDEIARALVEHLGTNYMVSTTAVVRERLLGVLFESFSARGRGRELPLRVESGWLRSGRSGQRFRFLGGELDMLRYIEELGAVPFLDLPRTLVRERAYRARRVTVIPGRVSVSGADCSFMTRDQREFSGAQLTWAAGTALDSARVPRPLRGIFHSISATTVGLAGADPDSVEYVFAETYVGQKRAKLDQRVKINILLRNELGVPTSGWGIPRQDLNDELTQREVVEHAELHVSRMKPDGPFDQLIGYLQRAGIQSMGLELPSRRVQREGLILVADLLLARASHAK